MIIHGDCIEEMSKLEENSVDAIVDDPPYFLGFMGKDWDTFKSPKAFQDFMCEVGKAKLRVLKPGGYNLSFCGTRTYHRLVCGIENAGFTIKDQMCWMYGSGFPKSLDISKAIDKHLGLEQEVIGKREKTESWDYKGNNVFVTDGNKDKIELEITKPNSPEALKWNGYGTALKPAFEPIVVAQKPYEKTYAENVLKYGVGGLNIDDCRIQYQAEGEDPRLNNEAKNISRGKHTHGTVNIAPDGNEMRMFKKEKGRFPSNVLLTHHPECVSIGTKIVGDNDKRDKKKGINNYNPNGIYGTYGVVDGATYGKQTVEAYNCHPACPIRLLDEQSGITKSSKTKSLGGIGTAINSYEGRNDPTSTINYERGHNDKGGASRFFYCGKAHKSERNAGLDSLQHIDKTEMVNRKEGSPGIENPRAGAGRGQGAKNDIATLKPINVMRYLVRLVCPPNGTVLDPFAGSGTTGIACIIEGFNYILIEKRKRFAEVVIPTRLKYWKDPSNWKTLKDHNTLPKISKLVKQKTNTRLTDFL